MEKYAFCSKPPRISTDFPLMGLLESGSEAPMFHALGSVSASGSMPWWANQNSHAILLCRNWQSFKPLTTPSNWSNAILCQPMLCSLKCSFIPNNWGAVQMTLHDLTSWAANFKCHNLFCRLQENFDKASEPFESAQKRMLLRLHVWSLQTVEPSITRFDRAWAAPCKLKINIQMYKRNPAEGSSCLRTSLPPDSQTLRQSFSIFNSKTERNIPLPVSIVKLHVKVPRLSWDCYCHFVQRLLCIIPYAFHGNTQVKQNCLAMELVRRHDRSNMCFPSLPEHCRSVEICTLGNTICCPIVPKQPSFMSGNRTCNLPVRWSFVQLYVFQPKLLHGIEDPLPKIWACWVNFQFWLTPGEQVKPINNS